MSQSAPEDIIPRARSLPEQIPRIAVESPSSGYSADKDESNTGGSTTSSRNLNVIVERLLSRRDNWNKYGNHWVIYKNLIIIGPVRSWWWLLELLTIIVFCTLIYEHEKYYLAVLILSSLIFLAFLISSFITLFMDSGIIKKPDFEEALRNARDVVNVMKTGIGIPYKVKEINGNRVRFTYCFICHVFRGPGAGHCSVCQCCHDKWDHHCPVIGVCVAKRNFYAFNIMTLSITIFYPFMLINSVFVAVQTYKELPPGERNFITASLVLDEVIIGIVLAILLPPLLFLLPCEQNPEKERPDNAYMCNEYPKYEVPVSHFGYHQKTSYYNSPNSRITFTTFNMPRKRDDSYYDYE